MIACNRAKDGKLSYFPTLVGKPLFSPITFQRQIDLIPSIHIMLPFSSIHNAALLFISFLACFSHTLSVAHSELKGWVAFSGGWLVTFFPIAIICPSFSFDKPRCFPDESKLTDNSSINPLKSKFLYQQIYQKIQKGWYINCRYCFLIYPRPLAVLEYSFRKSSMTLMSITKTIGIISVNLLGGNCICVSFRT